MSSKKRKRDIISDDASQLPTSKKPKLKKQTTVERVYQVTLKKALKKSVFLSTDELKHQFLKLINETVEKVTILVHEAWMFANISILKLIEKKIPLPCIDNGFFNQCLAEVSKKSTNRGRPGGCPSYYYNVLDAGKQVNLHEQIDKSIWKSCVDAYDGLRGDTPKVFRDSLGHVTSFTSTTMETCAQNHIRLNLRKRLWKFVLWKLQQYQSKSVELIKVPTHELRKQRNKLGNIIMDLIFSDVRIVSLKTNFDTVEAPEGLKSRALEIFNEITVFIKTIPKFSKQTTELLPVRFNKETESRYLYLLKWIADQYSAVPEEDHERSKFRHYSLLPLANGFQGNFISIDKYGLYQLAKSLTKHIYTSGKNPSLPLNQVFDLNLTKNQLSGASLQTDGVALHIHYLKVVPPITKKTLKKTNTFTTIAEYHDQRLRKLREMGNIEIVGVDPGRRDIITASHLIDDITANQRFQSRSYSNGQYRHDSGSMKRMKAVSRRINNHSQIKLWLKEIPIKKTCVYETLCHYVKYLVPKLQDLVSFFSIKLHKSLRFNASSKKKSTLDYTIPKIIVDVLPKNTQDQLKNRTYSKNKIVVAFGNAGFDPCSRGNAPGPTKAVKKALVKFGFTVIGIDEHLTSQKCCVCHEQLTADKIEERVGSLVKKNTHCHPKASTWSVRRCTNDNCRIGHNNTLENFHSTLWNRDINASYNMASILRHEIEYNVRPEAFKRSPPPQNMHGR